MKNITLIAILSLIFSVSCTAQTPKEKPQKEAKQEIVIETSLGNITIALYNETPLHRDNFIKLANEHFYDSLMFHRVMQQFMIQAGDPDSKTAEPGKRLGMGGPGYTIPAEIRSGFSNRRGAVAAARLGDQQNPNRESSGSQFYIVDKYEGATWLDGQYTVFGEVISGMDVVDQIAAKPVDQANRPIEDIRIITMKVLEKK